MRYEVHALASAAVGALIYRRNWRKILATTLGGVIIDVDHIVLYAMRSGDWSLDGALRYDRFRHQRIRRGDTRTRYGSLRSVVHQPRFTLPLLALLALAWPRLRPFALGIALHLALDVHLPHYDWRAWQRAAGRCEGCGVAGLEREVYYRVSPKRGGSRLALNNRVVWCASCMRDAYRDRGDV
jgi:hypothetical protein